jgi:hypothetical protein
MNMPRACRSQASRRWLCASESFVGIGQSRVALPDFEPREEEVSDTQNPKAGERGSLQDVIDAVRVLSTWVDIMQWAANNVANIVNQERINSVDRKNLATQADLITKGLNVCDVVVETLKRTIVYDTLPTQWNQIISLWKGINKDNPESNKDKVASLVKSIEAIVPSVENVLGWLIVEREKKKNTPKGQWLTARAGAISDLPELLNNLEKLLPVLDNKNSRQNTLLTIRGIGIQLEPFHSFFWMFKDDVGMQVGSWLMSLVRLCDSNKEWNNQTVISCYKCIGEIRIRLPKLVPEPEFRQ